MTGLGEIRERWREAGPVNRLIALQGFADKRTFLTKGGEVGVLIRVRGVDAECLDHGQIDRVARSFESAVRGLDERFDLMQFLIKESGFTLPASDHPNPVVREAFANRARQLSERSSEIYSIDLYFALAFRPAVATRGYLSWRRTSKSLNDGLDGAIETLRNKAESFVVQLKDTLGAEIVEKEEAFQFFRRLLNFRPACKRVQPKRDHGLDYALCDADIECHRDHLRIDDRYVQVLTLKEPPSASFAHLLRSLEGVACDVILVNTWRHEPNDSIRREIRAKRRHFHNSKASMTNYIGDKAPNPQEMLIDESATGLVAELGGCLREIEINGNYFGRFSMTAVLIGADLPAVRRAAAECTKALTAFDAQVLDERYNLLNAYLAVVPGNRALNLRELWLLNTNYADLSFLFAPSAGDRRNDHLDAEHLAVLETPSAAPYFLNLHVQDVAHTLILGSTGSGKSFFLNFLLTNLQQYDPLTFIFDLGGSYEYLTRLFNGGYMALGSERRAVRINPFRLEPTDANLNFLGGFVRVLIESGGYRLTSTEERDMQQQIVNLYELDPEQRRLLTLANIVGVRCLSSFLGGSKAASSRRSSITPTTS